MQKGRDTSLNRVLPMFLEKEVKSSYHEDLGGSRLRNFTQRGRLYQNWADYVTFYFCLDEHNKKDFEINL
jgi:hypothetical protein